MPTISEMTTVYDKHKHLKNAALELGMKWQTLYWNLKKVGHKVVGDKSRHGSTSDKLASKAELEFKRLVPFAEDLNEQSFQSLCDFKVGSLFIDIKASSFKRYLKRSKCKRWAFSIKKQKMTADFIVAFGYIEDNYKCFMFPGELIRNHSTISISENGGKWSDYEIKPEELRPFFENMMRLEA